MEKGTSFARSGSLPGCWDVGYCRGRMFTAASMGGKERGGVAIWSTNDAASASVMEEKGEGDFRHPFRLHQILQTIQ